MSRSSGFLSVVFALICLGALRPAAAARGLLDDAQEVLNSTTTVAKAKAASPVQTVAFGPLLNPAATRYAPSIQLNGPSGLTFRPNTSKPELWVVNSRSDSVTIISRPGEAQQSIENRQDAYAEHFMAVPSGISFGPDGQWFATSHESKNEVRNMTFYMSPERDVWFKGNSFMGPTLFRVEGFALANQNKGYIADWPQHGYSDNEGSNMTFVSPPCDPTLYPNGVDCRKMKQGSHVDMLHFTPLAMGIKWWRANAYLTLDGCGQTSYDARITTPQTPTCSGKGHLVSLDFNQDHDYGRGFHGDAVYMRYLDVRFDRVPGVHAGMELQEGWLYFSNTGGGTVLRVNAATGTKYKWVSSWDPNLANATTKQYTQLTGNGPIKTWSDVPDARAPPYSGDGEDPVVIAWWVDTHGNKTAIKEVERLGAASNGKWNGTFIWPRELVNEYSVVLGAEVEVVASDLNNPSGMVMAGGYLFVAEHGTGIIRKYDPKKKFALVSSSPTGASSLQGLAADFKHYPNTIFFTDSIDNTVSQIKIA